jgi:hypothetical protein
MAIYEKHTYERRAYERCPYERHAYDMADGRDTPMRWLWEMHAYERCTPMRWLIGEARL